MYLPNHQQIKAEQHYYTKNYYLKRISLSILKRIIQNGKDYASDQYLKQNKLLSIIYQLSIVKKAKIIQMDINQSEFLPHQFFNFKNSDKNSDILSLNPSIMSADCLNKKYDAIQNIIEDDQPSPHEESLLNCQISQEVSIRNQHRNVNFQSVINHTEISEQQIKQYFNVLFSPKIVTESLVRRNQYLEMKCLENSESQPQEIYQKRKDRVCSLQEKQKKNWQILQEIKKKDPKKFKETGRFMKLLADVKLKMQGVRHDYYSQKTFLTLKKASAEELQAATKILSQILQQVIKHMKASTSTNSQQKTDQQLQQRMLEFLIIPRFFISKEKLIKFIKDQKIQESFIFLISYGCLGHYNNEANKKLPQQKHMNFAKKMITECNDGKERFKKICGINHGGKFIKKFGDLYYDLYSRSLSCLKIIDQLCKKNCKLQSITKQIQKDKQNQIQIASHSHNSHSHNSHNNSHHHYDMPLLNFAQLQYQPRQFSIITHTNSHNNSHHSHHTHLNINITTPQPQNIFLPSLISTPNLLHPSSPSPSPYPNPYFSLLQPSVSLNGDGNNMLGLGLGGDNRSISSFMPSQIKLLQLKFEKNVTKTSSQLRTNVVDFSMNINSIQNNNNGNSNINGSGSNINGSSNHNNGGEDNKKFKVRRFHSLQQTSKLTNIYQNSYIMGYDDKNIKIQGSESRDNNNNRKQSGRSNMESSMDINNAQINNENSNMINNDNNGNGEGPAQIAAQQQQQNKRSSMSSSKSKLKMKRWYTMQAERQRNIIIVPPPSNHNHNHNHNSSSNNNMSKNNRNRMHYQQDDDQFI